MVIGMTGYTKSTRIAIAFAGFCLISICTASAQVYKCTDAKNNTVYADRPCSAGAKQTLTGISSLPETNDDLKEGLKDKSSITRQMDDAVKLAISNDDLIRAQALASTAEQKSWVYSAKKEEAKRLASLSASQAGERGNSAACKQARRDVEKETASGLGDPSVLNAKTGLMQEACGITVQAGSGGYNGRVSPYLLQPYPYGQYPRHYPPSSPYNPSNIPPAAVNSPPYDRNIAPPFGSRFIRPPAP